jgi:hypothetical protein
MRFQCNPDWRRHDSVTVKDAFNSSQRLLHISDESTIESFDTTEPWEVLLLGPVDGLGLLRPEY